MTNITKILKVNKETLKQKTAEWEELLKQKTKQLKKLKALKETELQKKDELLKSKESNYLLLLEELEKQLKIKHKESLDKVVERKDMEYKELKAKLKELDARLMKEKRASAQHIMEVEEKHELAIKSLEVDKDNKATSTVANLRKKLLAKYDKDAKEIQRVCDQKILEMEDLHQKEIVELETKHREHLKNSVEDAKRDMEIKFKAKLDLHSVEISHEKNSRRYGTKSRYNV